MTPRARYLSTTVALLAVAVAYVVLQGWPERPGPPRPAPAARPAAPPPAPPTAREILDRGADLSLTRDQAARLEALDREWSREAGELQAAIREAEREFTAFAKQAQAGRGASVREIQQRSADYSHLSALLRERRRRHGEAALEVLTEDQRSRLAQTRRAVTAGGER